MKIKSQLNIRDFYELCLCFQPLHTPDLVYDNKFLETPQTLDYKSTLTRSLKLNKKTFHCMVP